MTVVLGIAPDMWISSAALIVDGEIVAACPEERFDRVKMSRAFPINAINFCLVSAGLKITDVDTIAIPWNPGSALTSASSRYLSSPSWRGEYLHAFPGSLLNMMGSPSVEHITQHMDLKQSEITVKYLNHHLCHISSAYFLSGFNESAVLTTDGRGDDETGTWGVANGDEIKIFQSSQWPHSLGLFYSAITQFLGFEPHSDEWKVMALAAYGDRDSKYYKLLNALIKSKDRGLYEIDLSFFTYYFFDRQPRFYANKLSTILGHERKKNEPIEDRHRDIAAALQRIFEETCFRMLDYLVEISGSKNLCFAGGSAMNSVFNGKILKETPFDNIFIPPFPDDSGVSIGAAVLQYQRLSSKPLKTKLRHNYFGPAFLSEDIGSLIKSYGLNAKRIENIEEVAAQKLAEGNLIGWFQGRAEFGQRALGNRSILADPRGKDTQEKLNAAVKFRESFRPFAPSILEEFVEDYFDIEKGQTVDFMERVYPVKRKWYDKIPAVVFVDGSGRLQSVNKNVNPRFHKLIFEFYKLTAIPILVNTSFNLNGEPVVSTPTDAIRTFYSCGLNILFIEDWCIIK